MASLPVGPCACPQPPAGLCHAAVRWFFYTWQITKRGGLQTITTLEETITIAIIATNPVFLLPDALLVAQPIYPTKGLIWQHNTKFHHLHPVRYELKRLFPLRFIKISVHNAEKQQLKLKLANRRIFYLQLCPQSENLFNCWVRIIQLVWPRSESKGDIKPHSPRNYSLAARGGLRSGGASQSSGSRQTSSPKCPALTAMSELMITTIYKDTQSKSKFNSAATRTKAPDPSIHPSL